MPGRSTWSIRKADLADAPRVEEFLLTIPEFSGTIFRGEERQIWTWLFAVDGGVDGAYLAEDDAGSVVGHYGSAPWPFWADGRRVDAGLLCKLAIDSRYRRTPLFMNLSQQVLRTRFREGGPAFSIGVVNRPGILPFHLFLGLTRVGVLPVYAKPLRSGKVARSMLSPKAYRWAHLPMLVAEALGRPVLRMLAMRPSRGIAISRISAFGPEFDRVDGFLSRHAFRSVRSAATLTRRYLSGSPHQYEPYRVDGPGGLAGYFVLRRMQMREFDVLALVDVCLDPEVPAATGAMLRFVDRAALDAGVDMVSAMAPSAALRRVLRRGLYFRTPEAFTLIVHDPHESTEETSGRAERGVAGSSISEWYFTWHDSDHV
jgi:hypothetical protein